MGSPVPSPVAGRRQGRLRRAWSAGAVTSMRVILRVPRRLRVPVARPIARGGERLVVRRPDARLLPALVFVAGIAADDPQAAASCARRVGTHPAAAPGARHRLARLAMAAHLQPVAAAIAAAAPEDHAPDLEVVRAQLAYDAGRWSDALALTGHVPRHPDAGRIAVLAAGKLVQHTPGWLPDPGPGVAQLRASLGRPVRGTVVHVVSSALPYRPAGYGVRTRAVAHCQRAVGLDPHVAVRTGFPRSAIREGDRRRRDVDGIPTWWFGPDPTGNEAADALQAETARRFVSVVAEWRPAVLHAASDFHQAQVALAVGRPLGIPVVYEARGFWEESWASGAAGDEAAAMASDRYRLTRDAETAVMLAADAVVTLSEVMRREITARGCPPERIVIVPNAVEVERFTPMPRDDSLGATLGIRPDDQVVGYISTFNRYEGIGCLLEAAALLRPVQRRLRVLLVGDGPEAGAIREAARRLGLDDGTLVMPGRVPHEAVLGYYSLIDVFVVPRTTHRVSRLVTPLKPYEAMALERAVVVSDLPALREIVQPEETGLVFRPEDAADLAGVLGRLLDDPALRARLGRQAREWIVHERTWTSNGRRYRDLFERLGVA